MISYCDIAKLFSYNLYGKYCIEIDFLVKGYPRYQSCWMGKTPDETDSRKEVYWYGLVPDYSESYYYYNFHDFSSAPIFNGKSLKTIWGEVEIISINGCDPEEQILRYLSSL